MITPRPWQLVTGYLLAIAALILVGLNRGSGDNTATNAAMIAVWCLGAGVLMFGVFRLHGSQFRLPTLCLLVAGVAVYLGLCRVLHPAIPTLFVAYGLSVAMLAAARRGGEPRPLWGPLSRLVMTAGGLLFLAFFSLMMLGFLMQSLGWWTASPP